MHNQGHSFATAFRQGNGSGNLGEIECIRKPLNSAQTEISMCSLSRETKFRIAVSIKKFLPAPALKGQEGFSNEK